MAKITLNNISHDKGIELLGKSLIVDKQTELTMQMSDKLIKLLAPTGGGACTAPATVATAACKVVAKTFTKCRYDLATIKAPAMGLWVKELKKVYDDVRHCQNADNLELIGELSNKKYTFT